MYTSLQAVGRKFVSQDCLHIFVLGFRSTTLKLAQQNKTHTDSLTICTLKYGL